MFGRLLILSSICTLGFPALRASVALPVFITNSHCTHIRTFDDGIAFTQPYGQQIGHEIDDPPSYTCGYPLLEDDCRNSDSAMIEADVDIDLGRIARTTEASPVGCENCSEPLTIDLGQPTFIIGARNDHVYENETLNKIGRTTGCTRGNVEDTCDDVESELKDSDDPWVKECFDRVDVSIDGGDSGAPVFSIAASGTVELRGIVHTKQLCCFGWVDAWISDLHQIELDLGPLTVFDPGPPGVTVAGPTEVAPGVYCSWGVNIVHGVPPFSYEWSGMFTGSGPTVQGFVGSGGNLSVEIIDGFGRQDSDAIQVVIEGDPGPVICE